MDQPTDDADDEHNVDTPPEIGAETVPEEAADEPGQQQHLYATVPTSVEVTSRLALSHQHPHRHRHRHRHRHGLGDSTSDNVAAPPEISAQNVHVHRPLPAEAVVADELGQQQLQHPNPNVNVNVNVNVAAPISVEATSGGALSHRHRHRLGVSSRDTTAFSFSSNILPEFLHGPLTEQSEAERLVEDRKRLHRRHHHHHHQEYHVPKSMPLSNHLPQNQGNSNTATARQHRPHDSMRQSSLKRRREVQGCIRASQNVQREFAQQVSLQLEALEQTFREAVRGSHNDEVPTDVEYRSGTGGHEHRPIQNAVPLHSSNVSGNTKDGQNRMISGYDGDSDGDNDEEDVSD